MQDTAKAVLSNTTEVVATRIPKDIYAILLDRSETWNMSISALVREVVVKVFSDDQEIIKIKHYRKRTPKYGKR